MTQLNLFMKQKQSNRHRKQAYDYHRGKRFGGRDKQGVWDQQIQTAKRKRDQQQGPTV